MRVCLVLVCLAVVAVAQETKSFSFLEGVSSEPTIGHGVCKSGEGKNAANNADGLIAPWDHGKPADENIAAQRDACTAKGFCFDHTYGGPWCFTKVAAVASLLEVASGSAPAILPNSLLQRIGRKVPVGINQAKAQAQATHPAMVETVSSAAAMDPASELKQGSDESRQEFLSRVARVAKNKALEQISESSNGVTAHLIAEEQRIKQGIAKQELSVQKDIGDLSKGETNRMAGVGAKAVQDIGDASAAAQRLMKLVGNKQNERLLQTGAALKKDTENVNFEARTSVTATKDEAIAAVKKVADESATAINRATIVGSNKLSADAADGVKQLRTATVEGAKSLEAKILEGRNLLVKDTSASKVILTDYTTAMKEQILAAGKRAEKSLARKHKATISKFLSQVAIAERHLVRMKNKVMSEVDVSSKKLQRMLNNLRSELDVKIKIFQALTKRAKRLRRRWVNYRGVDKNGKPIVVRREEGPKATLDADDNSDDQAKLTRSALRTIIKQISRQPITINTNPTLTEGQTYHVTRDTVNTMPAPVAAKLNAFFKDQGVKSKFGGRSAKGKGKFARKLVKKMKKKLAKASSFIQIRSRAVIADDE